MNVEFLKTFLLTSTLVHYGILLVWFGFIVLAPDFVYRLHTRWFTLSRPTFDGIHYGAMAAYKLGVLLTGLVPWIALSILTGSP